MTSINIESSNFPFRLDGVYACQWRDGIDYYRKTKLGRIIGLTLSTALGEKTDIPYHLLSFGYDYGDTIENRNNLKVEFSSMEGELFELVDSCSNNNFTNTITSYNDEGLEFIEDNIAFYCRQLYKGNKDFLIITSEDHAAVKNLELRFIRFKRHYPTSE